MLTMPTINEMPTATDSARAHHFGGGSWLDLSVASRSTTGVSARLRSTAPASMCRSEKKYGFHVTTNPTARRPWPPSP